MENQYKGYTLVALTTSDNTVCHVIESPETVAKLINGIFAGPYVMEVQEGVEKSPEAKRSPIGNS